MGIKSMVSLVLEIDDTDATTARFSHWSGRSGWVHWESVPWTLDGPTRTQAGWAGELYEASLEMMERSTSNEG